MKLLEETNQTARDLFKAPPQLVAASSAHAWTALSDCFPSKSPEALRDAFQEVQSVRSGKSGKILFIVAILCLYIMAPSRKMSSNSIQVTSATTNLFVFKNRLESNKNNPATLPAETPQTFRSRTPCLLLLFERFSFHCHIFTPGMPSKQLLYVFICLYHL